MKVRRWPLRLAAVLLLFIASFAPDFSNAAIAVIRTATSNAGFGGAATVSFASTPAVGNAVIVVVGSAGTITTSVTDNQSGNTYSPVVQAHDSSGAYSHAGAEIWVCPVLAGATGTFTVTANATNNGQHTDISIMEVSGLGTVDQTGSASDVAGASTTITPTASGANIIAADLVVGIIAGVNDSGSNLTSPPTTGYTSIGISHSPATGIALTAGYKILSATETSTVSATWTTASFGAGVIATFKPSIFGAALAGAATDAVTAAGALSTIAGPFTPILLDNAAHVNGSDNVGMGTGPGTGTGDTANTAFTKLKQWAADANANFARLFPVRSVQTPTTGFAITAAVGVTQLVLNPAGTLATGAVTVPQLPGDNQPFLLMTSQTITALTVNTADGSSINGAPTTLSANSSVKFRFVTSLNTWFRE